MLFVSLQHHYDQNQTPRAFNRIEMSKKPCGEVFYVPFFREVMFPGVRLGITSGGHDLAVPSNPESSLDGGAATHGSTSPLGDPQSGRNPSLNFETLESVLYGGMIPQVCKQCKPNPAGFWSAARCKCAMHKPSLKPTFSSQKHAKVTTH